MSEEQQAWRRDEAPFVPAKDAVSVWRVRLDPAGVRVDELRKILSDDERERADRFYSARHRDSFILARGALRLILAGCLERDAESLHFAYGPQGKPRLTEARKREQEVRFNLSHSGGLALIAITREREVGVDIEWLHRRASAERLPERFFSPLEVATLRALPEHIQRARFFVCWTRKEAYIKARGGGLSIPLNSFDVSLAPGQPAQLLAVRQTSDKAAHWRMIELFPTDELAPADYVAALIVEGHDWKLELRQWAWPSRFIDPAHPETD